MYIKKLQYIAKNQIKRRHINKFNRNICLQTIMGTTSFLSMELVQTQKDKNTSHDRKT